MRGRQLPSDEARHGRFAETGDQAVNTFERGAGGVGNGKRNRFLDSRRSHGFKQPVDEIPNRQRFAVRDEIRLAGDGAARSEAIGGQEVRRRRCRLRLNPSLLFDPMRRILPARCNEAAANVDRPAPHQMRPPSESQAPDCWRPEPRAGGADCGYGVTCLGKATRGVFGVAARVHDARRTV